MGIRLDLGQGFAAILAGHVQVQQDQSRARRLGGIGVLAAVVEIVHQLFAVLHKPQLVGQPLLFHRLVGQQPVVGIVFGHEDRDRSVGIRHGLPFLSI